MLSIFFNRPSKIVVVRQLLDHMSRDIIFPIDDEACDRLSVVIRVIQDRTMHDFANDPLDSYIRELAAFLFDGVKDALVSTNVSYSIQRQIHAILILMNLLSKPYVGDDVCFIEQTKRFEMNWYHERARDEYGKGEFLSAHKYIGDLINLLNVFPNKSSEDYQVLADAYALERNCEEALSESVSNLMRI